MKIRIDGTPEEIEQAAHIFGPSCGPIKLTKKRDGSTFGYIEVEERQKIIGEADEIIGYNVWFDLGFLDAVRIAPYDFGRKPKVTDTMYEFAKLQGDWDSAREEYKWYKLTEAARTAEYGWTDEAHGSLADALACLAVQKYVDAEWRRLQGPEGIQLLYPNFRF